MAIIKMKTFLYCTAIVVPLFDENNNFQGNSFIPSSTWSIRKEPEHNVRMEVTDVPIEFIAKDDIWKKS